MRDEHMVEAVNLSRRQGRDIAQVKEDRAFLEHRFNVKRRVAGAPIDQYRVEKWPHNEVCASLDR